MTEFLVKHFVKDYEKTEKVSVRTGYGILASMVGIFCNVLLFLMKITIGMMIHSISVIADADEKSAKVVVPDYQLSLAIGKEGQNARLAARLTGFKIDIKSETQARESGDFMDYENDYEEDDYDDDYDYSDDELAENERLADTEQADVQAEAFDTEADENEAAGTENDAADSGDEQ